MCHTPKRTQPSMIGTVMHMMISSSTAWSVRCGLSRLFVLSEQISSSHESEEIKSQASVQGHMSCRVLLSKR